MTAFIFTMIYLWDMETENIDFDDFCYLFSVYGDYPYWKQEIAIYG